MSKLMTIGLDLSLTATGIATVYETTVLKPKKLTGLPRMRWIEETVYDYVIASDPPDAEPIIAVEGPSYGSVGRGQHERGGLWWHVVERLDAEGFSVVVIPPTVLKKYATGKGNAGKDEVLLAASRRFDWFSGGNDEADALWLAAIGMELIESPVVAMPAANRSGIAAKVTWMREPALA